MAGTLTPAAIMREAYTEEVAKYAHIPRKVMDMEQVMEAGFRAALRSLAAMEPTTAMLDDLNLESDWDLVRKSILAAASEGEVKP